MYELRRERGVLEFDIEIFFGFYLEIEGMFDDLIMLNKYYVKYKYICLNLLKERYLYISIVDICQLSFFEKDYVQICKVDVEFFYLERSVVDLIYLEIIKY